MKFKVGQKITLKDGYEYKFEEKGIATIDSIDGSIYNVTWSNGGGGCYVASGMLLYSPLDKDLLKLKEDMLG